MKKNVVHLFTIIKLCFFLLPLCFCISIQAEPLVAPGIMAPEFNVQGSDTNIKLSDYRGKTVYLDFWASWCTPCRKSFPWMGQMHKKYQSQGLVVIAINLDKERKLADKFLQQYPGNFILGFDPAGTTPMAYKILGMPSAVLIDKTGVIVSRHIGFSSGKQQDYEQAIRSALN